MDQRAEIAELFLDALVRIAARTFPQPSAWERHQLSEALVSIEVDDVQAAYTSLKKLNQTPTVVELREVWRTPRLTLEEIRAYFDRVRWAVE